MYECLSKKCQEVGPYAVEDPYSGFVPLDRYTKARIGFSKYSTDHSTPGMLAAVMSLIPVNELKKLRGPYRNRFL